MRVLDIGCGVGDVSFLAARIIGSDGAVVGVDCSSEAVDVASARAVEGGLTNVQFVVADGATVTLPEPVDMVVGRLVLMYLPSGGGHPPSEDSRQGRWGARFPGVRCGGGDVRTSLPALRARHRPNPADIRARWHRRADGPAARTSLRGRRPSWTGVHVERQVERGPDAKIHRQLAGITRALLPLITRTGVASAGEVDIGSLEARLREEARALDATLVAPPLIGAWARNVRNNTP